jgi:hypothetical protein
VAVDRLATSWNMHRTMTASQADRLPAYLTVRAEFQRQMRAVFSLATRDEVHSAAKRLKLFPDGDIILNNNQETDFLVDWMIFQHRRQGKSLSRIAFEALEPNAPELTRSVLAGMSGAVLGLFRVLSAEPGVGIQAENTWSGQRHFIFEREVSRSSKPGEHLMLRMLVVGDMAVSGSIGLSMHDALLTGIRNEQAAGNLPSMEELAQPGPQQDEFFGSTIASIMNLRSRLVPQPASRRDAKVGRNDPCPCGSGKKFKKCCGV